MSGGATHAGGVVHRDDDRILLVRARPSPHEWVLPKGHIEEGETAEEAAVREVAEEAGAAATVVGPLGVVEFVKGNGKPARVQFFLMRYVTRVPSAEERQARWWSFDEALATIPYENTRAIIEAARRLVRRSQS